MSDLRGRAKRSSGTTLAVLLFPLVLLLLFVDLHYLRRSAAAAARLSLLLLLPARDLSPAARAFEGLSVVPRSIVRLEE